MAPCAPSTERGHDPFRYRSRIPKQCPKKRAKINWMIEDFDSFHAASLRKLILGSLPKRAAKYGCSEFDLEDEREYCGDDGVSVKGSALAGVAAYIVRCAVHPIDYLFSLRNVPSNAVKPIKAYLRVKLAMGRLKAEINNASNPSPEDCSSEVPDQVWDDKSNKPPPTFTWHTSPAKSYGFKEMTETYGYDPRDTSVYWIEKRADALRRKWKNHGQKMRGEAVKTRVRTPKDIIIEPDETTEPVIKYFTPADADYNSVWPPVKMPEGPPKAAAGTAAKDIENDIATSALVPASDAVTEIAATFGMTAHPRQTQNQTREGEDCPAKTYTHPSLNMKGETRPLNQTPSIGPASGSILTPPLSLPGALPVIKPGHE